MKNKNWYDKRKCFLEQNQNFLKKQGTKYSPEELFYMQKLYLIYPNEIPMKLLSLPWDYIKVLLNICNHDKRDFYVDLCFELDLSLEELKEYILKDIYEKHCLFLKNEGYVDINKVMEIKELIWN